MLVIFAFVDAARDNTSSVFTTHRDPADCESHPSEPPLNCNVQSAIRLGDQTHHGTGLDTLVRSAHALRLYIYDIFRENATMPAGRRRSHTAASDVVSPHASTFSTAVERAEASPSMGERGQRRQTAAHSVVSFIRSDLPWFPARKASELSLGNPHAAAIFVGCGSTIWSGVVSDTACRRAEGVCTLDSERYSTSRREDPGTDSRFGDLVSLPLSLSLSHTHTHTW